MKTRLSPILAQVILYLVQYTIIPALIPVWESGNYSFEIISCTTVLIASVCMTFFSSLFRYWVLGYLVYLVLITVHPHNGYYNIGYGTTSLTFLLVYVYAVFVLILEIIVWVVIAIIKRSLKQRGS